VFLASLEYSAKPKAIREGKQESDCGRTNLLTAKITGENCRLNFSTGKKSRSLSITFLGVIDVKQLK
jgi:hypothetical protein